jgi:hypothetical protein
MKSKNVWPFISGFFSTSFSRFIRVVACISIFFLFMDEYFFWIYFILFIHSSVNGYFGSLHFFFFLPIMDNAVMTIHVLIYLFFSFTAKVFIIIRITFKQMKYSDLQWCIRFWCTKSDSFIHIKYTFFRFNSKLLQDIEL